MATKKRSKNIHRRDQALITNMMKGGRGITEAQEIIAKALKKRKTEERNAFLTQAIQELEQAQSRVLQLFDEGAKWERKFSALEEACNTSTALDLETVAWLYWTTKRFFETGLHALISIQKSTRECEHCHQQTDLPFAVLSSNVGNLRDVLQQAGVSMPDLCLTVNETQGNA